MTDKLKRAKANVEQLQEMLRSERNQVGPLPMYDVWGRVFDALQALVEEVERISEFVFSPQR